MALTESAELVVGQGKYGEQEQIRTEGDLRLALSIDKGKQLSDSHWLPLFGLRAQLCRFVHLVKL